ncbi:hypothetical protein PHYC_01733 [Phycisphaerales bacterium]|nr:hypothetical protein PHYC_01733 [Phycisphaerales bacterium]
MNKISALSLVALFGIAGCRDSDWSRSKSESSTDRTAATTTRTETHDRDRSVSSTSTSPDARILAILHAVNREEIEIGTLAQQKGQSLEVRDYGAMLVRDHTANDTRVQTAARTVGITLMSVEQAKAMMKSEKGGGADQPDALTQLRAADGSEFDRKFATLMRQGHADVIRTVEAARANVRHAPVRDLLDQTIPTLREHEKSAANLLSDTNPNPR